MKLKLNYVRQIQLLMVAEFGLGAIAGYGYAKRTITKQYEEIIEREVAAARKFVKQMQEQYDELADAAVERINVEVKTLREERVITNVENPWANAPRKEYGGHVIAEVIRENQPQPTARIEATEPDISDFDYQTESAKRQVGGTYIITVDEWSSKGGAGENHENIDLTFYKDDEVLVDDQHHPISDEFHYIGMAPAELVQNLGYGSGDPRVLYVRNEKLGADFTISAFSGNYSESVFGVEED